MKPTNEDVEKLTKDLIKIQDTPSDFLGSYFPCTIRGISESLVKEGYIHSSRAIDFFDICDNCEGRKLISIQDDALYFRTVKCPICQGRGIVLKEKV